MFENEIRRRQEEIEGAKRVRSLEEALEGGRRSHGPKVLRSTGGVWSSQGLI